MRMRACRAARNNIFILFYFWEERARAIPRDYFVKARGFKTQRSRINRSTFFYSPNLQLYYYMLCSAGILFCFKQAEWKERWRKKALVAKT
jgi:hypothetical protein